MATFVQRLIVQNFMWVRLMTTNLQPLKTAPPINKMKSFFAGSLCLLNVVETTKCTTVCLNQALPTACYKYKNLKIDLNMLSTVPVQ